MPRKLLLLSYSFPPHAAPEAFLSAKTLGGMRDFEIDVICLDPRSADLPVDPSLDAYVEQRFARIERVAPPGWMKPLASNRVTASVLAAASQFPDRFVFAGASAAAVGRRLGLEKYDALVSWSQYHSSHLAALRLKRQNPELRWLAHFSDPWVDNPFNRVPWLTGPLNLRLERRVIEAADSLIFTSRLTLDLVLSKYPASFRDKASVIAHPFDPALYPKGSKTEDRGPKVIRYLGNFYGARTPDPLLKALCRIRDESPELMNGLRVELIGPLARWQHKCEEYRLPERLVQFLPSVDYLASLGLMKSADALLVIDAPAETSVFLPSKLVDYIGSRRPILGITPPGTSAQVIAELGYPVADPSDVNAIASMLRKFLGQTLSPGSGAQEVYDRFSVQRIADQMGALI